MAWQSGFVTAYILQAAVLATFLWGRTERPGNRILALTLAVLLGMLLVYPLGWHGRNDVPVWLAFLPLNLPLALGPLIFEYTRSTAQRARPRSAWLHFAPAFLQFAYLTVLSLAPLQFEKTWKEGFHDPVVKPLIELAVLLSLAGYGVASLKLLKAFRARLLALRSDADLHDARWLQRVLATLMMSLAVLATVRFYTSFVGELDASSYVLWLALWSAWLGIEGWRVATTQPPDLQPESLPVEEDARQHDWALLGQQWQARTRESGWWREPNLTLAELARRIGTNTLYLSRAINDGLGMNFNEMINRLRSEEVARIIEASPATINDLLPAALEAGFSSKATFNRAFRTAFGVNPSEYRRRLTS